MSKQLITYLSAPAVFIACVDQHADVELAVADYIEATGDYAGFFEAAYCRATAQDSALRAAIIGLLRGHVPDEYIAELLRNVACEMLFEQAQRGPTAAPNVCDVTSLPAMLRKQAS